jgi:hypothetical protein
MGKKKSEQIGLVVLPAPDPDWSDRELGVWLHDIGEGAEGILVGAQRPGCDAEVRDALLWLAQDLGALVRFAARRLSGKNVTLGREPVGENTYRIADFVRILSAHRDLYSDSIDFALEGIAARLIFELGEQQAKRREQWTEAGA